MKKWRNIIAASVMAIPLALPASVRAAASDDDEDIKHDARIMGYHQAPVVDKNSTALVWLLFAFMSVVCLAALFKDAKRSHLD